MHIKIIKNQVSLEIAYNACVCATVSNLYTEEISIKSLLYIYSLEFGALLKSIIGSLKA